MTHEELYQSAVKFIAQRIDSPAHAWPRFGRDIALVEEDGPAGSLLFSCHTDASPPPWWTPAWGSPAPPSANGRLPPLSA